MIHFSKIVVGILIVISTLFANIALSDATVKINGGVYTGDIVDGVPYGNGYIVFPDGSKYTGEWKNGKRHGQGIWSSKDNSVIFKGKWIEDKLTSYQVAE